MLMTICHDHLKPISTSGILVRNEAAREELRRQVGDIGLIMFVITKFFTTSRLNFAQFF
jgi:hypothetical protein